MDPDRISDPIFPVRTAAPNVLTLFDGVAEAIVVPELGAGLASYDLVEADNRTPLFRPRRDLRGAEPFDLANNLLLPWSNRISQGGFRFGGRFHPIAPNLSGEAYPIHGNGFSSAWSVESTEPAGAELSLISHGPGPFRYRARASYGLQAGALTMRITIVNLAIEPLPFGLGFHPWIVRTADTQLSAKAKWVVLETSNHLPSNKAPVSSYPQWDFRERRELPTGWINNAFLAWDGQAEIAWRDRKLALEVEADPPLAIYIVYSPSAEADFFCFEPVTHPVDAHNLSGGPQANHLVILQPQASLSASCRFRPRRIG
ncbi:MAG: aldose 1-epimerase [Hyphomicrobiales bacterium]|jgi:aldose 1-epimerase|nr:aldose 1-epimerase [Hyphomicrobiales bacterium]MBV9910244.1 aldose 1-epimerase [Hyphomicrobiales bacterium]